MSWVLLWISLGVGGGDLLSDGLRSAAVSLCFEPHDDGDSGYSWDVPGFVSIRATRPRGGSGGEPVFLPLPFEGSVRSVGPCQACRALACAPTSLPPELRPPARLSPLVLVADTVEGVARGTAVLTPTGEDPSPRISRVDASCFLRRRTEPGSGAEDTRLDFEWDLHAGADPTESSIVLTLDDGRIVAAPVLEPGTDRLVSGPARILVDAPGSEVDVRLESARRIVGSSIRVAPPCVALRRVAEEDGAHVWRVTGGRLVGAPHRCRRLGLRVHVEGDDTPFEVDVRVGHGPLVLDAERTVLCGTFRPGERVWVVRADEEGGPYRLAHVDRIPGLEELSDAVGWTRVLELDVPTDRDWLQSEDTAHGLLLVGPVAPVPSAAVETWLGLALERGGMRDRGRAGPPRLGDAPERGHPR